MTEILQSVIVFKGTVFFDVECKCKKYLKQTEIEEVKTTQEE